MLIEHVIYSLAIAIIFGVLYRKHTGRELSWIIIMSAYASDFDLFMENLLNPLGITVIAHSPYQDQVGFHNLSFLLLYAAAIAFLLSRWGFKFWDAFIFAGVGFGAHLFEDALVFKNAYPFFWPLTTRIFGIGIVDYRADFWGIADITVLLWGLAFLLISIAFRIFLSERIGGELIVSD